MTEQNLDDPSSLLNHLSQKPGVRSTLVLSTENGAIIQASGAIAQKTAAAAITTSTNDAKRNSVLNASSSETTQDSSGEKTKVNGAALINTKTNDGRTQNERKGMDSAEDVARMAFEFVRVAGNTLEGLDSEDNVRLLRMRTKKVEFVIVPDPKYILVAVHDMPSA